MGRNTDYTEEMAERICDLLSEGESLRRICLPDDMPNRSTVMRWLDAHPDFATKYARARDIGLDERADRMEDTIRDEPDGAKARLYLDYGKWYLSKLAPKRYGDKSALDLTSSDGSVGPTRIVIEAAYDNGEDPAPT